MPEDASTDRASTWDIVSLDEAIDADDASRREGGTHLKYGQYTCAFGLGSKRLT